MWKTCPGSEDMSLCEACLSSSDKIIFHFAHNFLFHILPIFIMSINVMLLRVWFFSLLITRLSDFLLHLYIIP